MSRMKIYLVDIAAKVPRYDEDLADSLGQVVDNGNKVKLFAPGVSDEWRNYHSVKLLAAEGLNNKKVFRLWFLIIKTIKTFINYLVLLWHIWREKPDVLHIEWLPLLDYVAIECSIVSLFKKLSPQTKLVYTIHNIFPHNASDNLKRNYKQRFLRLIPLIDHFVVHTNNTKDDVIKEYNIEANNIAVIPHGIFTMKGMESKTRKDSNDGKVVFIMYGNMEEYKGTDLLVQALALLPDSYKDKIRVKIIGRINSEFYTKLSKMETGVETIWMPHFVDDDTLCQEIVDSDVILLPYRAISQSGVLLLALSFQKCILTSDLPSFHETLDGYDDNMFFESNNAQSLSDLIVKYLNNEIDVKRAVGAIKNLNEKYSWSSVAKLTVEMYNQTTPQNIV